VVFLVVPDTCVVKIHQGLVDLVFPVRCIGCGDPRHDLCRSCVRELRLQDFRSRSGLIPVFSSIQYGSKASHVLLAAKEDGVRKADDIVLAALAHSFRCAVRATGLRPALVPIPHRKQAVRRRGRNFVGEITDRLAVMEGVPMRNIIRHNRKVKDQSLLDSSSRFGNLSGAMSVVRHCGRPCEVFIVDDLFTTGATLGEAVRTLEKGGFHVVAAVTALVALPLR
jgi:predicted amidophosphoribosyltransferase